MEHKFKIYHCVHTVIGQQQVAKQRDVAGDVVVALQRGVAGEAA